jgi:hypothetical protein
MSSSYGQGSIANQPKARAIPAPGPPFVPTSADNGLSVDAVTGRIVLGNDVGGTGAELLSDREILFEAATGRILNFVNELGDFIQFSPQFGITHANMAGDNFCSMGFGEIAVYSDLGGGAFFRLQHNAFSAGWSLLPAPDQRVRLITTDFPTDILASFDFAQGDIIIGDSGNTYNGFQFALDNATFIGNLQNNGMTAAYGINGNPGVSGSFTAQTGEVVTVEGGIITSIV